MPGRLKQFHVVLLNQTPKGLKIRWTRQSLIERRASLGKEHFESRPRKKQQQACWLVALNRVLMRYVFRRVDEVAGMADHSLLAAGQFHRSLENIERFRLPVMYVKGRAAAWRLSCLYDAE